ncbi:hypothetical protein PISL3812_02790 [Talaromyces islandicus]|uniref:Fe2OG dioxygenase domain-containing protein n=1 Tax=Talaromyces islandicus TaxID=28573 RepID=A0A0U1LQW0_TALIS|nr:hypothetical protein PISL3812_02790 [Talaromyces islandicus]
MLTKTDTLLAAPLPAWLHEPVVSPRLDTLGCFAGSPHQAPNHVLINEYRPGQGIMPHEDGSAYYPLVATVSLGAPIVLDLYEKKASGDDDEKGGRKPAFRILQEPRSLLITTNELYTQYLHGIAECLTDEDLGFDGIANWEMLGDTQPYLNSSYERQTRVSLTYRDVLKVAKVGNSVKFLTTGR